MQCVIGEVESSSEILYFHKPITIHDSVLVDLQTSSNVGVTLLSGVHSFWFSLAADKDDGYAELNLGVMYEEGRGVPQNLERAKQLYARLPETPTPPLPNSVGSTLIAFRTLGCSRFGSDPWLVRRTTQAHSGASSSWVSSRLAPRLCSARTDRIRETRMTTVAAFLTLRCGTPSSERIAAFR
jgi:hypothetical protein